MKLQLKQYGGNKQKRGTATQEISLFKHCRGPAMHAAMIDRFYPRNES